MKRIVKSPQSRRAEIVAAARELFFTKDFDQATMQDVMAVCKIAKGTIYHYFKSKEELLEAVVLELVDSRLALMDAQISNSNALDNIKKVIELGQLGEEHLLQSLHRPANAALHIRLLAETLIRMTPIFERLIRQGCQEGLFQTDSPKECAEFLLSAMQFLTDTGIYPWSQEDLKRRSRAFPSLIEQQLKAPKGSFNFITTDILR